MSIGWRLLKPSSGRRPLALIWLTVALGVSALMSLTALAISWATQTWDFNVAGDYQVPSAAKIEFVPGPPSLARLKLNVMTPYTVNTNFGFLPRTNLTWNPSTLRLELLSASQPGQMLVTEPNVVALWRFNESSGTTAFDTIGNASNTVANNGTMSGFVASPWVAGTLRDAFGNATNALLFNGVNNAVYTDNTTDSPDLWLMCTTSPCPGFSIEAWVRFDRSATQEVLVSHAGAYGGNCWHFFPVYTLYKDTSDRLVFALRSFFSQQAVATNPISIGSWHHVVATYSGNLQQIFVDGAQNGTTATGFLNIDSSSYGIFTRSTWMGRQEVTDSTNSCTALPNYNFQGALDELAIYNTALTQAKVTEHYSTNSIKLFDPKIGSYVSGIVDADPVNQIIKQWQNLTWTEGPASGLGEELPNTLTGLQGLWHFNASSGTTVTDSKGSNNGTLAAGSPIWTTGKFGNGLYLDGVSNYVNIPDSASLNTPNITIEGWVRFDALTPGAPIFNRRTTGNVGGVTLELGSSNALNFWAYIGGAWRLVNSGPDVLTTGKWYHLAATYDGLTMRLYMNGVQAGSTSVTGTINNPASPLVQIGRNISGGQLLKGTVDEVAIYNAALPATGLTANDILTHYRQGSLNLRFQGRSGPTATPDATWSAWKPTDGAPIPNSTYGLVGLWHLDGTVADDIGGPSNTVADPLTLNGGPPYASAKFGQGLSLNGSQSASLVSTPLTATDNWTLEAWVYPTSNANAAIVYNGNPSTNGYGLWKGSSAVAIDNMIAIRYGAPVPTYFSTGVAYDLNAWNHVVAVRANTILKVYKNGNAIGSTDLDGSSSPTAPSGLQIGTSFGGLIDEVAIYNVALEEHSILNHYLGSPFTVSPATLATILGGTIPDNRYFQFRTFLSSDSPVRSPELSSVTVTAQNYPLDAPTIINTATKPIYTLLNSFAETRGPAASQGQVKYQLSPNGTQWYWYNGTSWVGTSGSSDQIESNQASELPQAVIAKFPQQGGAGNLQWKALFISNGQQPVELDRIALEYAEASLTLTAPALNETWLVGSTHTITWNTTGTIAQVNLQYSAKGDFSDTVPIATNLVNAANGGCTLPTGATGCYPWTLPSTLALSSNSSPGQGTSKLQISGADPGTASVTDTAPHSGSFTVTKFNVTAPPAGTQWRLGKQGVITWDASTTGLNQVKIEYSANNGGGWVTIASPTITGQLTPYSYTWNLPGTDLSYLSCDQQTPSTCTSPGPGGLIRVSVIDPAGLTVLTNTSVNFSVTKPFVLITEPGGQNTLIGVNTVTPISWQKDGLIGTNLKIEYSTNGFADETQTVVIVNGDNGGTSPVVSPYSWVVPGQAASPTVKIRITDLNIPIGTGTSNPFKVAGTINIASPVAGLKWAVGTPHLIQWTTNGQISNVKIELSKDGGATFPTVVASSVPNGAGGGSFSWTPAAADASANTVIRVSNAADYDVKKDSAAFLVTNATITSPAGGERWLVGSSQTIQWTSTGVTNVRVEYSTDNGATFPYVIAASVPASTGSLAWTVPDTIKKGVVKVRILDVDATGEAQAVGISNAFTIYGQLNLTAPMTNDVWNSGQPHTITWTTPVGTIPNVKLEYSRDNFASDLVTIAASTANTGSFTWTPNFTAGNIVKVRVSDAQDPLTSSTSGFFQVPGIAMQQPAGGEVWDVGSAHTITWTFTGSFTHVKLEYSTDNFATSTLIQDNVLNTGNFSWTVPDAISSNVKIRVTPTTDATLFSTSNAFSIKGVLTLTAPNGGEVFDVGSNQTISWTTTGTVPTVLLQLSRDGGSSWANIATVTGALGGGTSPVANTYAWTVPDAISSQARVRVVDAVAGHPASSAASNANFTIRAAFTFTSPTSTDVWAVNQSPTTVPAISPIQWTTRGTVSNVKLEYYAETAPLLQPIVLRTIVNSTPNTGRFDWTVPDIVQMLGDPQVTASRQVRIRVSDADAHPPASTASQPFTVKWFKITWNVKDASNQAFLSGLNVTDTSVAPPWSVNNLDCAPAPAPACLVAPVTRYYPYGLAYNTVWSKKGYFNGSANGWAADADKTITVFLESELTATIPFQVHVESAYDAATDTLKFKTWLERRGILLGAQASDLARLGASTIQIFDGANLVQTLTTAVPNPDGSGSYSFTWTPTNLVAGNVYFAQATVVFDGTARTSGGSINVTIPKQIAAVGGSTTVAADVAAIKGATVGPTSTLGQVQTDVSAIKTETVGPTSTLGKVSTAVMTTLPAQITAAQGAIQADVAGVKADTTAIKADTTAIKADTTAIKTDTAAMRPIVQDMGPKVTAILSDPNAGLPKVLANQQVTNDQLKAQRRGGILNRDMAIELGESATIQYRPADASQVPTMMITNASGNVLPAPIMQLNANGLYQAVLSLASIGEYRVIVTEPSSAVSNGTVDSIALTVRAPKATAQAVTDVSTQLTNLSNRVTTIDTNVNNLVATAAAIQTTVNATKTLADQLALDTRNLLSKWGSLDAQALRDALTNLSTQVGTPAQAAQVQSALTALTTLQNAVTTLQTAVGTPAQAAALTTMQTNVTNLQSALNKLAGTQNITMDTVNARFDELKQTIASLPQTQVTDQTQRLTGIATQITTLQQALTALGQPAQGPKVDDVLAKIDTVRQTLTTLQSQSSDTSSLMAKLDELQKAVASAQGSGAAVSFSQSAYAAASQAVEILHQLQAQVAAQPKGPVPATLLTQLQSSLGQVGDTITVIPGKLNTEELNKQLAEVAEQMKALSTKNGYTFDQLYETTAKQGGDVKTVRNRVEELKTLLEVQKALLEHKLNEPVVKTWFESSQ